MIQLQLQRVVADVIVVIAGDLHVGGGIGQPVEASHAIVQVNDDVLSGAVLLAVQEFRHFFGTLREAVAKTIGVALLRLDVELVLALEIVEVSHGELENVGLLQLRDVLLAVGLLVMREEEIHEQSEKPELAADDELWEKVAAAAEEPRECNCVCTECSRRQRNL